MRTLLAHLPRCNRCRSLDFRVILYHDVSSASFLLLRSINILSDNRQALLTFITRQQVRLTVLVQVHHRHLENRRKQITELAAQVADLLDLGALVLDLQEHLLGLQSQFGFDLDELTLLHLSYVLKLVGVMMVVLVDVHLHLV